MLEQRDGAAGCWECEGEGEGGDECGALEERGKECGGPEGGVAVGGKGRVVEASALKMVSRTAPSETLRKHP